MPTFAHAEAQAILVSLFRQLGKKHRVHGVTELRLRMASDLFRIPDVVVFAGPRPAEAVPSSPPLVVIEVTSPDDRYHDLLQKLEEYRAWGIPHIWVVEPELRQLHVNTSDGLARVNQFELSEFDFRIAGTELFTEPTSR